jgi:hypothetical protein
VAQHLVCHWRCRADHKERAEVDGHRDCARHQDEHLRSRKIQLNSAHSCPLTSIPISLTPSFCCRCTHLPQL